MKKIVLKVSMSCDECRNKAMKIAAARKGVNSVAVEGEDKDKLVVMGEGFDSVTLTKKLRKKVGPTDIVAVEEKKDEKKKDEKNEPQLISVGYCPYLPPAITYDYDSPSICSIL